MAERSYPIRLAVLLCLYGGCAQTEQLPALSPLTGAWTCRRRLLLGGLSDPEATVNFAARARGYYVTWAPKAAAARDFEVSSGGARDVFWWNGPKSGCQYSGSLSRGGGPVLVVYESCEGVTSPVVALATYECDPADR